jgi:excisionase family DNA binding protein
MTELLTAEEAAQRLGVEAVTLAKWRSTRRYKLSYTKIGGLIRYPAEAIEQFIRSRTITPGETQEPDGRQKRQRRLRSEK